MKTPKNMYYSLLTEEQKMQINRDTAERLGERSSKLHRKIIAASILLSALEREFDEAQNMDTKASINLQATQVMLKRESLLMEKAIVERHKKSFYREAEKLFRSQQIAAH